MVSITIRVLGRRDVISRVAATPITYQGQQIQLTVSIGFAVAEAGVPTDQEKMLEAAAAALNDAKHLGRNRCEVRRLGHQPAQSPGFLVHDRYKFLPLPGVGNAG